MEQQPHCANERTKSKQNKKASHVAFKLTTGSIVRFSPQTCNVIIKGWLNCLTLVSKRRFLVNNIMFGSV